MKTTIKKVLPVKALIFTRKIIRRFGKIYGNKYDSSARIFSDPDAQIFFGYYDVTPFNQKEDLILAIRAPVSNASPHNLHPSIETGFFDISKEPSKFQSIGETSSWNWQQGCRLQWFDQQHVLYNKAEGAVIQNIYSKNILKKFSHPFYAIDNQRQFALTLNFENLHTYRPGYGYSNISSSFDGVIRINLHTGEEKEILNIKDFNIKTNSPQYLNHLSFNPSGTRFMVFHITDGPKRTVRLFTANSDGSELYDLPADIRPSHYCWVDDNNLLITGVLKGKVVYARLQDKSSDYQIFSADHLNQDGHPSFLRNGNILSDTYPDLMGRQKLFVYNPKSDKKEILASFYSPVGFTGEMRCDLHPRLSPSQNKVAVDIVHNNRRALCILRLDELSKNN